MATGGLPDTSPLFQKAIVAPRHSPGEKNEKIKCFKYIKKKAMKNGQKISKNVEKLFFYVKKPHKPYTVIEGLVGCLTRPKVPEPP